MPPPEQTPFLKLVLKQFEDTLVLILLAAAVVSFVLALFEKSEDRSTAFLEPAVILFILVANATVGVIQETNAEKSIEALRRSEARLATVVRDSRVHVIPAQQLVPGDILHLSEGDKVPADARIFRIETPSLNVEEAMLTGEAEPAEKTVDSLANRKNLPHGDQINMVFSGTLIVQGRAEAVVVQIGSKTAIGEIAARLQSKDEEEVKTPLQEKLDQFGEQLSKVIGYICVVVWLMNIGHFTDPEHGSFVRGAIYYFKIAVALAVAAIPEGLPAVVTTCLALGTIKMARKNAIVRSLPAVETLGCTTVICSDKTGTLTTNKMSVQTVITFDAVDEKNDSASMLEFAVDGNSYAPYGSVTNTRQRQVLNMPAVEVPVLAEVSRVSALCNEATLVYSSEDRKDAGGAEAQWTKTGSSTEAALKVLAEKLGVPDEKYCEKTFSSKDPNTRVNAADRFWAENYERTHLLEFDRDRKSMSVIMKDKRSNKSVLFCKGAPEGIFKRCARVRDNMGRVSVFSDGLRAQIEHHNTEQAAKGLRCLALAYKENVDVRTANLKDRSKYVEVEKDMVLVGLVCVLDPPRPEVPSSIQRCVQAGIRVIVITGDFQKTAEAICRRIGVFGANEDLKNKSFTGEEFESMSERERGDAVRSASLFSRVKIAHKEMIVKLLKKQGEICAMTGDGVNDATALKAANIGVAMGSGTDVAREASKIVLQDDNFATIVMAVEEGRAIYSNTKQFIRYLISSNIGEVVCIFLTAALGMPEALIPVQLLWVNLVTDGLPATALGFNPPERDIMRRAPRHQDEPIVNGWMFFRYMAIGTYVGVATVLGYIWWCLYYAGGPQITFKQLTSFHSCSASSPDWKGVDCAFHHDPRPSTMSLSILVTIEMFNALNALSENQSLFLSPPWTNMWVIYAICLSFTLHFVILYVPFFATLFRVAPLTFDEWVAVVGISFPVFIIDEVLKLVSRNVTGGWPFFCAPSALFLSLSLLSRPSARRASPPPSIPRRPCSLRRPSLRSSHRALPRPSLSPPARSRPKVRQHNE